MTLKIKSMNIQLYNAQFLKKKSLQKIGQKLNQVKQVLKNRNILG